MPPSTPQDCPRSIHSWWSDRNPGLRGPTINLHTVAKPLLKRMHHRQALQLIRKNRESPLSTTTLEMYLSYFPWNFVSPSTKDAILEELMTRSASEADALVMVHSPFFNDYITRTLGSPDFKARISSCELLARLAGHKCTTPAILKLKIHKRLMLLWLDEDYRVTERATYTLSWIARWLGGAQAIVDAKALGNVLILLRSPRPDIRECACALLGRVASHDSTGPAILEFNPCMRLATCLRDENSQVVEWATYTLSKIARSLEGAQAIVDAKALDHALILLLESSSLKVRNRTCMLVGRLVGYKSTALAILKWVPPSVEWEPARHRSTAHLDTRLRDCSRLCGRLVDFLRQPATRSSALFALRAITKWPDADRDTFEQRLGLGHSTDAKTQPRYYPQVEAVYGGSLQAMPVTGAYRDLNYIYKI